MGAYASSRWRCRRAPRPAISALVVELGSRRRATERSSSCGRRPDVREALGGQIDLFLVDEFQDTSPIQLAVFLELAQLAKESVWVGDPKQAIFAFRGTDPSLMDAAIESLASVTSDPELVSAAMREIGRPIDTLSTSYRSRPALVALTSEIFATAFASQGMPEDRTRLAPSSRDEPNGLGPIVEHWPLEPEPGHRCDTEATRAEAVAAGVRELLARTPLVRAGATARCASRRDVAVLCRTNKQCQAVADALGALGVPAIVPRMRLLDTLEARVILAGLALWVDPGDALAAAELARMITYPTELDALVERALEAPGRDAFASDPTVARLLAARDVHRDLGPVAAVDAVIASTDLRTLCAAWGDTPQRLGNLDAFRAHAVTYATKAAISANAATIVGLLRHLEALVPKFGGWDAARFDRQALLAGEDAVTISTWHRAKGLEWPITVLFGLESMRQPASWGVHVMTDRSTFDMADPLADRWIRYWPNPYRSATQLGAVRTAYERTVAHRDIVAKANREALRVLYVGWTRARDRLVLAAKRGQLLDGIIGTLRYIDPALVTEPSLSAAGIEQVRWAGIPLEVHVAPSQPMPSVAPSPVPGTVTVGRPPAPMIRARTTPSSAAPVPCTVGEIVTLGPRIAVAGAPDMEIIGNALHGVLAADRPEFPERDRLACARALLAAHRVDQHLDATDVLAATTRLWAWIAHRFPGAGVHREWPVAYRTEVGTIVAGTADLVVAHVGGVTVVDHKTFPGRADAAAQRALGYSGQLAAYAAALHAATRAPIASTWIHFPVRGQLVELRLDRAAARGSRE
jgi:ATP-dependent helicase/nuclease subunit A